MVEKGVIVEFDFAAMEGAGLLQETTACFLGDLDGIPFDARIEAKYLSGGNYQGALAEYFAVVKTKKTAAKAARDLSAAFVKALDEAVPKSVTPAFRNFVKALSDKGVKVVIATRADVDRVAPAFAPILSDKVVLYHEESQTYGAVKWDAWRRACVAERLKPFNAVVVTGSGLGVKSALIAGIAALAVTNAHVAYQDFSGADAVVSELGAPAAKKVLDILRV